MGDDIYTESQKRNDDQKTFFTRNLSPLLKNTYIYHNYAYGWIPETVIWSSSYANLDIRDYYPITINLLKKFEFMLSLYNGPILPYEEKINTEFISRGSFSGRYINFLRNFSQLPTSEFISFLLLTSMPIYNILFWFKNTPFDITKHTLFNNVFTTNEKHIELGKYFRQRGDYKPLFSRLKDDNIYLLPFPINQSRIQQNTDNASYYETLSNLSAILYLTNYDPVLMFLAFYVPNISVTSKITPGVEYLLSKLNMKKTDVVLV
ncbi:ER localized membrane protein [Swinepox virus]|uniref:Protein OPG070 n=1 Tax=Swinepox virus TaxID=10276 RepID=A0A881SXZ8_SWPV|nr:ER localized membrane protein [Swinepox virus]